jgi:hypothetical protein
LPRWLIDWDLGLSEATLLALTAAGIAVLIASGFLAQRLARPKDLGADVLVGAGMGFVAGLTAFTIFLGPTSILHNVMRAPSGNAVADVCFGVWASLFATLGAEVLFGIGSVILAGRLVRGKDSALVRVRSQDQWVVALGCFFFGSLSWWLMQDSLRTGRPLGPELGVTMTIFYGLFFMAAGARSPLAAFLLVPACLVFVAEVFNFFQGEWWLLSGIGGLAVFALMFLLIDGGTVALKKWQKRRRAGRQ